MRHTNDHCPDRHGPRPHLEPYARSSDAEHEPDGLVGTDVCRLIALHTLPGDLIADPDGNSVVATAAGWLGRRFTARPRRWVDPRDAERDAVRLIITRLPRPGRGELGEVAEWMRTCRLMLRPDGLVAAVIAKDDGEHLVTVATAASAAGLTWIRSSATALPDERPYRVHLFAGAGGRFDA